MLALDPQDVSASTVYLVSAGGGKWIPVTDETAFDDKPRWAVDGKGDLLRVEPLGCREHLGRLIHTASGIPAGEAFPITSFRSVQSMLTPRTAEMDIAVMPSGLLLPITESRGEVWMLDQIDR